MLDIEESLRTRAHVVARHDDETVEVVFVDSASALLHSCYSDIERAFYLIAKAEGGDSLASRSSPSWHRELLDFVATPRPKGCGIVDEDLKRRLEDLKAFRHVFRSSSTHRIDWSKVRPLLADLPSTFADTRRAIEAYLDKHSRGA